MNKKARKLNGEYILKRGSNKLYPQLNDLDALFEMLKLECPADVARKLKVPYNCVRYAIVSNFSPEQQAQVAWKRTPHKNKKRSDK